MFTQTPGFPRAAGATSVRLRLPVRCRLKKQKLNFRSVKGKPPHPFLACSFAFFLSKKHVLCDTLFSCSAV